MAPLPRILVAFIIGILLTCCYPKAFGQQYAFIASVVLLFLIYLPLPFLARKKGNTTTFGVLAILFAMTLGIVRAGFSHYAMSHPGYSKGKTVTATVAEYAVEKENSYSTVIDCGENGGKQLVYLWSSGDRPMHLMPGEVIQFHPKYRRSVMREMEKTQAKGEEGRQLLGYQRHLYYSHITTTQYANRWWKAKKSEHPSSFSWARLRKSIADQYNTLELPSEEAAILTAMTLGDRRALRERGMTLRNRYANAGVSHVLALSGFHLTIIYSLLDIFFLTSFFRRKRKWIPRLLIISCLWAYTLLAGSPPSLVRAAAMCTIISLAQTSYGGKQSGLDALVLSAFIMLLFDPFSIMNVSFQLSYVSMFGITLATPTLSRLQVVINKSVMPSLAKKASSYFVGIILISIIATVSTAGIVAYHFGTISLVGIATNICISILASALMTVAVAWWLFRLAFSIGTLLQTSLGQGIDGAIGNVIHWLLNGMNQTVDYFSSLPHATLHWQPSLWTSIIYYALLGLLIYLCKKRFSHLHALNNHK